MRLAEQAGALDEMVPYACATLRRPQRFYNAHAYDTAREVLCTAREANVFTDYWELQPFPPLDAACPDALGIRRQNQYIPMDIFPVRVSQIDGVRESRDRGK
jgi:hypothetical protein